MFRGGASSAVRLMQPRYCMGSNSTPTLFHGAPPAVSAALQGGGAEIPPLTVVAAFAAPTALRPPSVLSCRYESWWTKLQGGEKRVAERKQKNMARRAQILNEAREQHREVAEFKRNKGKRYVAKETLTPVR